MLIIPLRDRLQKSPSSENKNKKYVFPVIVIFFKCSDVLKISVYQPSIFFFSFFKGICIRLCVKIASCTKILNCILHHDKPIFAN